MPSITLLPSAAGTYQQWDVGAGSRPSCVQTNDADTSYIVRSSPDLVRDSYALDDMPAGAGSIVSVTAGTVVRRTVAGAGTGKNFLRYSGTDLDGASAIAVTTSFVAYEDAFANPPGGGSWTVAIVNATEGGYRQSVDGASPIRVTQIYLTVVYLLSAGCFLPLLSLAAAAIGPGLSLAQMPALARYISGARVRGAARSLILPAEYEQALASWRGHRFPRFVFLPGFGGSP